MARMRLAAGLTAAWLAVLGGASAHAAIPAGNLIVNGSAEAGTGALAGDDTTTAPVPIPGWTTTTNFTEHAYDPAGSNFFPDTNASALIGGGNQFFAGGPSNGSGNDVETATQDVNVSVARPEIDANGVSATLFADLGGFQGQEDQSKVAAIFLGSAGQQLGSLTIGPVTAADRNQTTELLPRSGSASVPGGTRTIRVVMTATKFSGAYNDAYLDNVSLMLVPPPVLGKTVNVTPIAGQVFVKVPAAARAAAFFSPGVAISAVAKGRGFIPLLEARQLPVGTEVDARRGTIQLASASTTTHQTNSGQFQSGLFRLLQSRDRRQHGLTTLMLLDGGFPGAPSYAICPRQASDVFGPLASTAISHRVVQLLRAKARGRFRTRGRYSAATVRGTAWDTEDRCDGTLTIVHRGTVIVTDFRRKIKIAVHAGKRYLAKAR